MRHMQLRRMATWLTDQVEPMLSLCGFYRKGLADVARHRFGKARYTGVQQSVLASRQDAS
jgi:hypothetical protein